jgi:hypothetical protein
MKVTRAALTVVLALGLLAAPLAAEGDVPTRGHVCGQDSQGRQARRPSRRAAHEVRAGDQPQDREGVRPDDPPVAAGAGGSGDRMSDPGRPTAFLFGVARDAPGRYEQLRQEFAGRADVRVVYERGVQDRRRTEHPAAVECCQRERRRRFHVDAAVWTLGWSIIAIPEQVSVISS